jgi:hypothetical protein
MIKKMMVSLAMMPLIAAATVTEHIGSYSGWDSVSWTAIDGINDGDNGLSTEIDFVGDSNDAGGYYSITDNYVFFRMRLDVDTVSSGTFHDAHLVLIDVAGTGTDYMPDYGFAWDSKSNDPDNHGLEMSVLDPKSSTIWNTVKMDDIDGSNGSKGVNDINGLDAGEYRTTDGYVRSIDGQATTSFGNTTFLDFAVSWDYLTTYTGLAKDQEWNIQFASIADATDHNAFADVAGGADITSSISTGWSTTAIPEPASIALMGMVAGGALMIRRIFC